jgi:hypothetical protein
LDAQVHFLAEKSFAGYGRWLRRKWTNCQQKLKVATKSLAALDFQPTYLQSQWEDQVNSQTLPIPQTSKKAGTKAIQAIMTLVQLGQSYKREKANLDRKISANHFHDPLDLEEAIANRDDLVAKIMANQTDVDMRKKNLGIENERSLRLLLSNKYLQLRVNAQALKVRIRTKLQARKFELERIDKAARNAGSGELKLQNHVQSQVNRHQPGISKNVGRYNDLVTEMESLISAGKAPAGAICPKLLDKSTLYSLSVDDSIWDDVGLEDVEGSIPSWLGDENVRNALPIHLELNRCKEEEARLSRELQHLQEWVHGQWNALDLLVKVNQCPDWAYQLGRFRLHLIKVVCQWATDVADIPLPGGQPVDWKFPAAASGMAASSSGEVNSDDELLAEDDWDEEPFADDVLDLVDMLETSYQAATTDDDAILDIASLAGHFSTKANLTARARSSSPRKRGRMNDDYD